MIIENNCPKCGRAISIDADTTNGSFICGICECEINLQYDMHISENGIETEIVIFKEKN